MTIARIEIDFAIRDDDHLIDLVAAVGDMVLPFLDPHGPDEECSRWVSISGYENVDDEYDLGLEVDDIEKAERKILDKLDGMPHEFRGNSSWN